MALLSNFKREFYRNWIVFEDEFPSKFHRVLYRDWIGGGVEIGSKLLSGFLPVYGLGCVESGAWMASNFHRDFYYLEVIWE